MSKTYVISVFLISSWLTLVDHSAHACSMYKITADNKTMVGCNQDAWRTTTNIWFKRPKDVSDYGACFTGSRRVGPNQYAPQSGMNEQGLTFSRLVAYHPTKEWHPVNKKQIPNEVDYLTDILHKCKNIDDVEQYISKYDHSVFIDDVYIYVDKSGDYLIVEPYQMIKGNDPTYILANFCPSLTSKQEARKQIRYKNGEDFLTTNRLSTSIEYCRSLSDTMSVCRSRNGDGTLLTSIWDTQKGLVNLYFYHNYDTTIQFNIVEHLALGDHLINIPELFPINNEFQRLIAYKTPFNVNALRVLLAVTGVFLLCLSFVFFLSFFRKRKTHHFNLIKIVLGGFNLLLFSYLFILATNINIYYFDAPYQDPGSFFISLSSYIPFLLAFIIVPLTYFNYQFTKLNKKYFLLKILLISNNIVYLILLVGFGYWGLFDIFS